jgi:hypothetical protein
MKAVKQTLTAVQETNIEGMRAFESRIEADDQMASDME